jgi:hypothetical protein
VFGIERFRFIKVKLKTIFFNEMYIDFGLHMIPVYSGFKHSWKQNGSCTRRTNNTRVEGEILLKTTLRIQTINDGIERFRFIKVKLKTIFFNEMYIDFGLHMIPVYSGFSLNRFHCMIFFRLISLQLWIALIILVSSKKVLQ